MRTFFQLLKSDQRGVTSLEYGLIVAAISLAIMATYFLAGDALKSIMVHVSSGLEEAHSSIGNNE